DGGYQGIERIRSPRRGPDRKIIKDQAYRRFRKRRAVAETPSHASRTTKSSASAAAREKGSTTPSPASPPCTT
ncbi:hypothetical protein AB0H07_39750, partial [Streptomyces sp. NPDC021354]